jgi:porin
VSGRCRNGPQQHSAGAAAAPVLLVLLLGALLQTTGLIHSVWAAGAGPPGASFGEIELPPLLPPAGDLWTRNTLLGDINGLRSAIAPYGLALGVTETSEILGNLTGGQRQGLIYEGVTDLNLGFDLQTHFDWRGVFFARAYQIHGRGLSANDLDNLNIASGIEATRATRLYELWYEQHIQDWLRIRIGQQSAGQEFLISSSARLFVNSTFGWPTLPSIDLPSGGPNYPLGTPAVRVRVDANAALTFFAGVFNGNPAGPGTGDPQLRDASGTAFRVNDGAFAIFEARYNPGNSPQNGTYRLGGWVNSERFPSQVFDTAGQSLANPATTGIPRLLSNDSSLYGIIDQPLFQSTDNNGGLTVFARAMGAPGDRNLVDFYLDGGVTYKGPFGRSSDTVGLAVGYARIGYAARQLDEDTASFTGQPYPIRSSERVLELTYQVPLAPWWQLQPDFQYVFNPGGGVPNPGAPGRRIGDAAILGMRTTVTF